MKKLSRNLVALFLFMVGYLAIVDPKVLIETLSSVVNTLLPFVVVLTVLAGLQVAYKVIKK